MSLVIVRKIQKGKWEDYCKDLKAKGWFKRMRETLTPNASADAITNCLKTTRNELSIWIVEEDHISDALLAMATGPDINDIGTIDYILFKPEEFKKEGLFYKESPSDANTAVPSLKQHHYNIKDLNYRKLGKIQKLIVKKLIAEGSIRKTRRELYKIVEQAIDDSRIDYSSLSEQFLEKLRVKFPQKDIPKQYLVINI